MNPAVQTYNWKEELVDKGFVLVPINPELESPCEALISSYLAENHNETSVHFQRMKKVLDSGNLWDDMINDFFVEIEWIIEEPLSTSKDYTRAQIQGYVRLISSRLAYHRALVKNVKCQWVDARDIFLTNDNWVHATVDVDYMSTQLTHLDLSLPVFVALGVGVTSDNENTIIDSESYNYIEF